MLRIRIAHWQLVVGIVTVLITLVGVVYTKSSLDLTTDLHEASWLDETTLQVELFGEGPGGSPAPLGLRKVFATGSRFRVSVTLPGSGHLYVVARTCGGLTDMLYPNSNEDSRVLNRRQMLLPSDDWLRFEEAPATDNLYVIFSRRPIEFLDELAVDNRPPEGLVIPRSPRLDRLLAGYAPNDEPVIVRRLELRHGGSLS